MKYLLENDTVNSTHGISSSMDTLYSFKHWMLIVTSNSFYDALSLIYMFIFLFVFGILINLLVNRTRYKNNIKDVDSLPVLSFILYKLVSMTIQTIAIRIHSKIWHFNDTQKDDLIKSDEFVDKQMDLTYLDNPICWFKDPTWKMLKESKNYFRFKVGEF